MNYVLILAAAITVTFSSQGVARLGDIVDLPRGKLGRQHKWEKKPSKKAAWIRSDHRAHAFYETVRGYPKLMIQAHY